MVFADLSGFTAVSEKLDPEEVTGFINACFERLEGIVLAHGGVVDEYLGDCVKAVFGFTPEVADPAVQAVKAALQIRAGLGEFNRESSLPSPLSVHIGIDTGAVVPVEFAGAAAGTFSVVGEAVRRAARLEDASASGQIFVGPGTYEETKSDFEYRILPPLAVDGGATVPVYELLAPAPPHRTRRASERRQATVVFADAIGLGDLSNQLGAQPFALFTKQCFEAFATAVAEHGGVVDKYTGDGIMALFGVPNAIENAPRQAVNAAIDVRDRFGLLLEDRGFSGRLHVHVGINTGLVIAGDIGGRLKRDFTVMGDTVNLAARLKESASPGAIQVGPETERLTRGDFEYRALEPLRLKGKDQPVSAFELASRSKRMHRTPAARRDRMVFSGLVGRESELAAFRAALERLVGGSGGIVNLVGEAGLGKSRLLSEGLDLAREMSLSVLIGRSLATGRSQSFHPFVDLLRHWAGIDEEADEEVALPRLEGAIRGVLRRDADEVIPFVTRLLGLRASGAYAERLTGIEGEALEKMLLKSTRELFRGIGERRPTLLVLEDLHWADQSSLNLLESLLPLGHETRLLFVHVFRPLFEETGDRILRLCRERFAGEHEEIRLEPLDAAQSALLVRNLLDLDELPPLLQATIAGKTEGNPFYIEEVVRSLIDEGAIEYRDGRFCVTERINRVVIPGTIQDVIMARVDRLDESARGLLQMASVVGRTFYPRILSHLVERQASLEGDLALLQEKQLIQESGNRWDVAVGPRTIADEVEYIFKHALAQEAVYESLLRKTRKELHGRVGEAIESLFASRLPEFHAMLAYHYSRAERLEPAERYLCLAGEDAISSAAFSEALDHFRQAAAIFDQLHGAAGGDSVRRAFLEKQLGVALLNTGRNLESIAHFDRALELLGESVPKREWAAALRWAIDMAVVLWRIYIYEGRRGPVPDVDRQRQIFKIYFDRGQAEVTSDPRRLFFQTATPVRRYHRMAPELIDGACGMYVSMATIFAFSGISYTISKRLMKVASGLLREDNIGDVFRYRVMLFIYDYFRGDWSDAPTLPAELVEEALRYGMVWDVTTYSCTEMDRHLRRGEFARARAILQRFAEIRDTYGYSYAENNREGMQVILGVHERQLDGIVALARRHAEPAVTPEPSIRLMTLGEMARAQMLTGDRDGAAQTLRQASELEKQERVVSPWHQSSVHVARLRFDVTALEAAAASGGAATAALKRAARKSARRAVRTAAKVAKERIETYRLIARLWWVVGNQKRAFAWWKRTLAHAGHMGARPELARAHRDIAKRIGAARLTGLDSAAHADRARQLFVELGLTREMRADGGEPEPGRPDAPETAVA